MKRTIIFPLIFLLCIGLVSAFGFPQVISGKVTLAGEIYEGITVELTGNGQSYMTMSDANGFYTTVVDSPGHYQIKVCEGNPKCVQTVYLQDAVPLRVDFDFTGFELKTTYFYIGGIAVLGICVAALAELYRRKKNSSTVLVELLVEEVLQNAENVALGKLKDLGDITEVKAYALEYEETHKDRARIVKYLQE